MSNWQTRQQSKGAIIQNGVIQHFGSIEQEIKSASQQTCLTDLDFYRLIEVTGTEAEAFLHGQFSNDLSALAENESQLSSYNSPKGRVLALFRAFKQNDTTYLRIPADIAEATLKRLQMFVMRADVKLEISNKICLGISGEQAAEMIKTHLGTPAPVQANMCSHDENNTICLLPGNHPRYELYLDESTAIKLWESLQETLAVNAHAAWEWLNIQQGQPEIIDATKEAFVAQMINLEPLNAISFTKGCYPGQEIVARMHYLGNLKRRMYLMHTDEDASSYSPGDDIYAQEQGSSNASGKIVSIQPSPTGGFDLLAVLQIQNIETEKTLSLDQEGGIKLLCKELPYEFAATSRQK